MANASEQLREAELRRRPDDDLLRQPRQMRAADRGKRQEFEREVAVDTVSIEFRVGSRKSSAEAVMARSIGKPVPASAAAPSGLSSMRSMASRTRDRSRPNIST